MFIRKNSLVQRDIRSPSTFSVAPKSISSQMEEMKTVYRANWVMALCVTLTFAIQYTFYPGVMFVFELSFFTNYSWFAISIVTFHSLMDTTGRYIGGMTSVVGVVTKKVFVYLCLSRFVFVVFYMLTYERVAADVFGSDWFIIVNLTFFSISCGILSTIGMNYGSDETTKHQSLAGSIMGFQLTLGICLGSAIALIFLSN